MFLALLVASFVATAGWPGLPPDCWEESRLVHQPKHWREIDTLATTTRGSVVKVTSPEFSPNGAYWFVLERERLTYSLKYFAEKDHLVHMRFSDVKSVASPRWINEKLLFVRVWVGRLAATDLIIDVEAEMIIHSESLRDGHLAMSQYKAQCTKDSEGCTCVRDES